MRAARWGHQINTDCDAGCETNEYLGHMIQKCPRTEGPRHERHNNIVKMLERELQKRGYTTTIEPRIPTNVGIKIPDLCAWKGGRYIVLDAAVVADTVDLDYVHESKKGKYDMPEIHAWMEKNAQERTSKFEPVVTACVCNWRGVMAEASYAFWRGMGFSRWCLMSVVIQALQDTYRIWRAHRCGRQ